MELITIANELMPEGRPAFLQVVKYPKIRDLAKEVGKSTMLKALFLMVKDFCSSFNVVRNMNEDQMIECAAMLLEECDNFRMEDYMMMFHLAKRGKLIKVMDRIDLQMVSAMMDEYWLQRKQVGQAYQEEEAKQLDTLGYGVRSLDQMHPLDAQMLQGANGMLGALEEMRTRMTQWQEDSNAQEEIKKIGEKYSDK